jgi:hypothetical protein
MANVVYNTAKKRLLDGGFNWGSLDLRVLLVTSGYVVDADDVFVDDLTPGSNELAGTGYVRKALASESTAQDDVNDRAEGDADDVTWTGINAGTTAAAVIFTQVTTDADSWLVAYIDTGGFPITTNGGDLTIQWNAEGILQLT